jgi:hypothetical protein
MFLSHNKSANSTFQPGFSAKRTDHVCCHRGHSSSSHALAELYVSKLGHGLHGPKQFSVNLLHVSPIAHSTSTTVLVFFLSIGGRESPKHLLHYRGQQPPHLPAGRHVCMCMSPAPASRSTLASLRLHSHQLLHSPIHNPCFCSATRPRCSSCKGFLVIRRGSSAMESQQVQVGTSRMFICFFYSLLPNLKSCMLAS